MVPFEGRSQRHDHSCRADTLERASARMQAHIHPDGPVLSQMRMRREGGREKSRVRRYYASAKTGAELRIGQDKGYAMLKIKEDEKEEEERENDRCHS